MGLVQGFFDELEKTAASWRQLGVTDPGSRNELASMLRLGRAHRGETGVSRKGHFDIVGRMKGLFGKMGPEAVSKVSAGKKLSPQEEGKGNALVHEAVQGIHKDYPSTKGKFLR